MGEESGIYGLEPIANLEDRDSRVLSLITVEAVGTDGETQERVFENASSMSYREIMGIEYLSHTNADDVLHLRAILQHLQNQQQILQQMGGKHNVVRQAKKDKGKEFQKTPYQANQQTLQSYLQVEEKKYELEQKRFEMEKKNCKRIIELQEFAAYAPATNIELKQMTLDQLNQISHVYIC